MTHAELVALAVRWLRGRGGCSVAFTEMSTAIGEIPDAIGFRASGHSVLVECKASRADFLADRTKPHRQCPNIAVGAHRYYLSPKGVLTLGDLPERWGLLHVVGGRIRVVRRSEVFERAAHREVAFLASMLRRCEIRLAPAHEGRRLHEILRWEAVERPS